jgi:small-conductance mechanosensitive channel
MRFSLDTFWGAARHMADTVVNRLPALIVAVLVFCLFYVSSVFVAAVIKRTVSGQRLNLGVVFARLASGGIILIGFLVSFSIVAPSFQAGDLIKILGIGGVAIGFAFQNILQNFLAGLLLLWTRQHDMLASYDRVLTAVIQSLGRLDREKSEEAA